MSKLDKAPTYKRDILLLVMGAVISVVTSFSTLLITNKQTQMKEERERKAAFISEMATNSGTRLFLLSQICQDKKKNDMANLKLDLEEYRKNRLLWFGKVLTYYPLINLYFGKNQAALFDRAIYQPTIHLGNIVTDTTFKWDKNTNFNKRIDSVNKNMAVYFDSLYTITLQEHIIN